MPKAKSTHLTSTDLLKQSDALRRQAEELKRKEIPEVVARIKEAISHYGLTAQDLGLAGKALTQTIAAKPKKSSAPKAGKAPSVVKYRDNAGHTWSGRGPKPKWFTEALAGGATQESLKA